MSIAPTLQQKVVKACLNEKTDISYYDRNRETLYQGLKDLGFECIKPEGAFYLFVKSPVEDERAFCQAAKKYNILIRQLFSRYSPYKDAPCSLPAKSQASGGYSIAYAPAVCRSYLFQELHGVRHQGPQRIHVIWALFNVRLKWRNSFWGMPTNCPNASLS